jgi:hypothetical protein
LTRSCLSVCVCMAYARICDLQPTVSRVNGQGLGLVRACMCVCVCVRARAIRVN